MHQVEHRAPQPHEPVDFSAAQFAITGASISLLGFSALTSLAIIAWFFRAAEPWSWKSVLAFACAFSGLAVSAFVWRSPSRRTIIAGIAVMSTSVLRIGPPTEWTWVTFALLSITMMFLVPLVHAVLLIR